MKPYRISFWPKAGSQAKRISWVRYGTSMDRALVDAKRAAKDDYPKAHGFSIESSQGGHVKFNLARGNPIKLNTVKALGDHSIRLVGTELTAYRRGGAKLARRYYANEGLAKAAYKSITSEKKLLAWSGRATKKNPPKRGNRWRMDDGSIVTSDQLRRKFFGKIPSPSQRRMLGITQVKFTKRKNPSHKGKTMAKKNPYRRTPINKSKAIPKGKRAGERFTRDGKTFTVVSYLTASGKRVRYARRVKARR